jgi:2-phosphoglycerate kinase
LQVDDLRLALQRTRATLPERTEALYFFSQEGVWQQSPVALRDGLTAMGEVMAPATEAVVENHEQQDDPCIIEGDGILPSLLDRTSIENAARAGRVRAVFLHERDESVLLRSILERDRGFHALAVEEQHTVVRAQWLFGKWVVAEARRRRLPVLDSRPWETLTDRIRQAFA